MDVAVELSLWDAVLMVVVTAMAALTAYFRHPAWKAFLLGLPLPFTCATLSLGQGVGISNVAGLAVLLLFTHGVRLGFNRLKLPIVPVILVCAAGYCLLATGLNRVLPQSEFAFWAAVAIVIAIGIVAYRFTPHMAEPHYRGPLPLWIKIPLIAVMVSILVLIKAAIGGFMSTFPMVGVFSAYESRYSLNASCRQVAMVLFGMAFMMGVIHATHRALGSVLPETAALAASLAAGWAAYLGQMAVVTRGRWILGAPEPVPVKENAAC